MAKNSIREKSTSGGVFPVIAYDFIKNDGFVAGAVFDKDWAVKHIVSDKQEDIDKMKGSKYLQSDIGNCYIQIKEILNQGKKVLFTGTPCQVAGLKSYLKTDYDNLFCADIICHGVPSKKVFHKYLNENFDINKITNINFRPKYQYGWSCKNISVNTEEKEYNIDIQDCDYFNAFLKDILFRKSCYICPYNKLPRQGDITMGDFWRINKYSKKYDDKLGTSVLLVNSKKGKFLFNCLKKNAKLIKKVPIKYALEGNPQLYKPVDYKKERSDFYNKLDKLSFKDNKNLLLDDKCDAMVLNLWFAANYGAILTCFGLQYLLEKLNVNAKIINFTPSFSSKLIYSGSMSEKFAKKYFKLTKPVVTIQDFINLNKYCSTFIAGSDQIWSKQIMESHSGAAVKNIWLLGFCNSTSKKISYAASLGTGIEKDNYEQKELFRHYLPQFDALSIREFEGQKDVKDNFDIESVRIIDGAFHIPLSILDEMTNKYKTNEEYIAYYDLPNIKHYNNQYKQALAISNKLNIPLKKMEYNIETSVEEWLAFIKNSKYVISSSYHAIVFAIIFNKPFTQIMSAKSQSRFNTLFKVLEIPNNSISPFVEAENIPFDKIFVKYDWEKINKNIEREIIKAEEWVKNALSMPAKDKNKFETLNYTMLKLESLKNLILHSNNKNKIYWNYYYYKFLKGLPFSKKVNIKNMAKYQKYKQRILILKSEKI